MERLYDSYHRFSHNNIGYHRKDSKMIKLKKRCTKCKMLKTFKSFDNEENICKNCQKLQSLYISDLERAKEFQKEDLRYVYYFVFFSIGFLMGLWIRSIF